MFDPLQYHAMQAAARSVKEQTSPAQEETPRRRFLLLDRLFGQRKQPTSSPVHPRPEPTPP